MSRVSGTDVEWFSLSQNALVVAARRYKRARKQCAFICARTSRNMEHFPREEAVLFALLCCGCGKSPATSHGSLCFAFAFRYSHHQPTNQRPSVDETCFIA